MKPREFEQLVFDYFQDKGYSTILTPYSSDYGVDVFAEKKGKKIAIQAKMYGASTRKVNRQSIMELYGAAAYFDCNKAVLATDGAVLPDALKVADKLNVEILYLNRETLPKYSNISQEGSLSVFDKLWEKYIMPLENKTLIRKNGETNTICKVDWSGIERVTSNGNRQKVKIEIFRYAVNRIIATGYISRDEINQNYTGRASSGIILILSQIPDFELTSRPVGLKLRSVSFSNDC